MVRERLIARCSKCDTPQRDKEQEHPGVCVCGGYIDDVPASRFKSISEGALLRTLLLCASELGARLFRNQRGVYTIAQDDCKSCQRFGRKISTGMANGAPDLVGWMPVVVTPDMVGRTVALFVGIEAKRPGTELSVHGYRAEPGRLSEDQRRFLTALETAGAVQGVVRSVAELETVLAPWRGRQP